MAAARRVVTSSDRSRERARKFGRLHTRPQKPEAVVFVLQPLHAPSITFPGSPHPTTVVTPDGKVVADLKAGEGASFTGKVVEEGVAPEPIEVDESVQVVDGKAEPLCDHCGRPRRLHGIARQTAGKPAVVAWSRVGEKKPEPAQDAPKTKDAPKGDPAPAAKP